MLFEARDITKSFQNTPTLNGVSFRVEAGEMVSIIGPSGVGKTTLLKIIAGLESHDGGELTYGVPPSREHPIILVFQDYLLFPALTVFDNIAFGLKARKQSRQRIREQVREMLGFFGMDAYADHYPAQLSAGQRQRVAIARAMVVKPELLLLDEPFANLDKNLKLTTAEFIRETQKTFGVTTISVTHDQEEAFVMSDRVGLMLDGRLVQFDTPQALYDTPVSLDAARFTGHLNRIEASQLHMVSVMQDHDPQSPLHFRPEHVSPVSSATGAAAVSSVNFAGHYARYVLTLGSTQLLAFGQYNGIRPGDRVDLYISQHMQQRSISQ